MREESVRNYHGSEPPESDDRSSHPGGGGRREMTLATKITILVICAALIAWVLLGDQLGLLFS